jgi:hypothetical protein
MVPADPTCGGGTVTRVNVYEGIVSVRHQGNEARVPAGGEWPSGCTNVMAVAPPSTPRGAAGSPPAPGVGAAGSSRSAPLAAAPDPSQLKEQNDCIARALTAKRSGAVQEAISAFEGCIAAYPSSPMVENAMVQRMRLLRTVEPSRAASAARQYLARYPHGFARAEAEAMVQQEP